MIQLYFSSHGFRQPAAATPVRLAAAASQRAPTRRFSPPFRAAPLSLMLIDEY